MGEKSDDDTPSTCVSISPREFITRCGEFIIHRGLPLAIGEVLPSHILVWQGTDSPHVSGTDWYDF